MQVGVILFDFAPDLEFAGLTVRWETVALAATVVLVLGLAALIAGRVSGQRATQSQLLAQSSLDGPANPANPADRARQTMPGFEDAGSRPFASTPSSVNRGRRGFEPGPSVVSRADLLVIAVSALPGAVIGGRTGYVLVHLDYYASHPAAIVDPGQGSLELGLATVGGTITALIVAAALRAPPRRWLHVAAIPVLLGLALGKLSMVLSGDGQGLPSDDAWATAYIGPGPWGSLAPQVPSHPAQLYEAGLTLVAALLLLGLFASGRFRAQDGRAFLAAILLWALVRVAAAFAWRDPVILGPLRAAQLIALAIAVVSLVLLAAGPALSTRAGREGDGRDV